MPFTKDYINKGIPGYKLEVILLSWLVFGVFKSDPEISLQFCLCTWLIYYHF